MKCPNCERTITLEEILEGDAEYSLFNFDGHSGTIEMSAFCPVCEEEIAIDMDIANIAITKIHIS